MEKNGEFIELEQTEREIVNKTYSPAASISTALKVLNNFEVTYEKNKKNDTQLENDEM